MQILKKEMKLKGLTSLALSEAVNVDPATVSAWLKGTYTPAPKTVKKLKELEFSDVACLDPAREVEI
jgi:transcriptional regulator with XRE-family HTH domain